MNGDQNSSSASSTNSFGSTGTNPYNAPNPALKNTMGASTFAPYAQPSWPPAVGGTFQPPLTSNNLSEFNASATTNMNGVASFSPKPATLPTARIRNLPLGTTEQQVRLITTFVGKDLVDVQVLPLDRSDDKSFQSALLTFKSLSAAHELKASLDGQPNIAKSANLIVEVSGPATSGGLGTRYQNDMPLSAVGNTSKIPTGPAAARAPSRYNNGDHYQPLSKIIPPNGAVYNGSGDYGHIFSPQSPIANHVIDRNRMTGKTLIENDDDDTDPIFMGYHENPPALQPRRSTVPNIPTSRHAGLSLNTNAGPNTYHYGHSNLSGMVANTMSPTFMGSANPYTLQQQPHRTHAYPAANPADQNPPCNTLYVGNLPIDTSEEELKGLFSKQRGYKRLCFRTKQNGPMCFVEFEDISFATKALNDLYGSPLHNSTKGGIRLSFSKNPLGVRNQPLTTLGVGHGPNGFTTASGPPPGLHPPPGFNVHRAAYNGADRESYNSSPGQLSNGSNAYTAPVSYTPLQNSGWGAVLPPPNPFHSMMNGSAVNGYQDYSGK
ncbi:hypothetical protein QBC35DRAFT_379653 [Podospora australis]|uniref:RRM domain-containing protein n=1 Tax=Podospora australis TaxID=1536484 RepID=A0AAN6X1F0_9PEZI|nr:hypothetical protein QBC35DRAFT_379653 [Podospora australis]